MLWQRPIFEGETSNPREFIRIIGDECEIIGDGNGSYQQVIRTDKYTRSLQIAAYPAIAIHAAIVKGK